MSADENSDFLLKSAVRSGMTDRKELAIFMGQMEVESGGFASMHENFNYSAGGLYKTFHASGRVKSIENAQEIVGNGREAIAEAIYGGEWGAKRLGNTAPGDGWKYHGRGYVMLTGRGLYEAAEKSLGVGFVASPDLAADKEFASDIALDYWQRRVASKGYQHDVKHATFGINGGYNALAEREAAAKRWETRLDLLFPNEIDASLFPAADWGSFKPDREVEHATRPLDINDAAHPAYEYFKKTLDEVRMMEEGNGLPHGPHSDKVAAALLTGALRNGHGITNVVREPDGRIRGYHQYGAFEPTRDVVVDAGQAQSVSMAQYGHDAAQALSPHLVGNAPALVRTREQERALDQLTPGDRALFDGLRRATPRHISDDVVAQATLQAKHAGIDATDQVGSVTMLGRCAAGAGAHVGNAR